VIVLVRGLRPVDALPAAVALRELMESDVPVAIVDGIGLEMGSAQLDGNALLDLMEGIVDAHERRGPHAYVVTVPGAWRDDIERLAFFLVRRRGQKVVLARFDQATRSPGAEQVASMYASLGEPASLLEAWSPRPPRIETERLILTWPTPAQIDGFYQAIAGTSMFDTICWDGPESPTEMHDRQIWARRGHAKGRGHEAAFGVIERESERQIGGVSFRPQTRDDRRADIGFALAPDVHGRGYGTEAVRALVGYGFETRGAERIEAEVFAGNEASRRVLEKVGFELEGVKRANVRKRGALLDEWLFSMTRKSWGR